MTKNDVDDLIRIMPEIAYQIYQGNKDQYFMDKIEREWQSFVNHMCSHPILKETLEIHQWLSNYSIVYY